VGNGETLVASVERKTLENIVASLSDATLSFQLQKLSELPLAAIVVEGRYSDLFRLEHVDPRWIAEILARLHARYPEIQVTTFADARKFAEEWTYRFLASAAGDAAPPSDL
jgi:ERCC4-type nuclease